MVQKEVAQRLCKPRNESARYVQVFGQSEIVAEISSEAFFLNRM
jgi:16S rRNA A1518/A1519 N6-dimethyltransferase RsmA/KsgA/DIM1 with predicted DNA glycosylase/AP lyase activity